MSELIDLSKSRILKIRCPVCDSDDLESEDNPKRNDPDWTWYGNSLNGLRCKDCGHWFGVDP